MPQNDVEECAPLTSDGSGSFSGHPGSGGIGNGEAVRIVHGGGGTACAWTWPHFLSPDRLSACLGAAPLGGWEGGVFPSLLPFPTGLPVPDTTNQWQVQGQGQLHCS